MIVNVFDPISGEFKCDVVGNENSVVLSRSLTASETSTIVTTHDIRVEKNDKIRFYIKGNEIVGKIRNVDIQDNQYIITFSYGVDYIQREVLLASNSITEKDKVYANFEDYQTFVNDEFIVISTDSSLYTDQICRQIMRKDQYIETIELDKVILTRNDQDIYKLRVDDPKIIASSRVIELVDDLVNELMLVNKDNHAENETYFLVRGTVLKGESKRPKDTNFINAIEFVEQDEYDDISIATESLKKNEYSNKVEFEMYNIDVIDFDKLLGRKCELFVPRNFVDKSYSGDTTFNTIISAYEINNSTIKLVFGLSKTNLIDFIGGD